MIDFGFDKIALIGAVALVVIGPEKLPRVARTVGHLLGKAQRYVADVKAEVNRSIELEELKKMKTEFEDAARDVEQTVNNEIHQTTSDLDAGWNGRHVRATGRQRPARGPEHARCPSTSIRRRNGASSAARCRSGTSSAMGSAARRSRAPRASRAFARPGRPSDDGDPTQ